MSPELIGTILTAIGLFITMLGAMATFAVLIVKRIDKRIDELDEKSDQRIR